MKYIKINSIPIIEFSHIFGSKSYSAILPKKTNSIEISYVTEGFLTFTTDNNSAMTTLKKNSLICNTYDKELNISAKEFHEHHTVCFCLDFETSDKYKEGFIEFPIIIECNKNNINLKKLIDNIIQTHTLHPTEKFKIVGLFFELINEISNYKKNNNSDSSYFSDLNYVNKAKNYIYNHIHKQIMQKDIAIFLDITPEYLCAIFKKIESVSLIKYINTIKLEKIKTLIEINGMKLYEACEIYGYSDPNYVSKLYKKYNNMNITDIKKNTFKF